MNSFDSVCVEELNGFADYVVMQELQAAEMAEFAEWIGTTLPTSEEMDQRFEECADEYENDGHPDEYTEWQDYMGGDDWDHGQYDCDY